MNITNDISVKIPEPTLVRGRNNVNITQPSDADSVELSEEAISLAQSVAAVGDESGSGAPPANDPPDTGN